MDTQHQVATEAVKATPAITVSGLTLFGVSLNEWVLILTAIYTVLQLFFLVRDKWWRVRKDK